jgi:hypothetical protein
VRQVIGDLNARWLIDGVSVTPGAQMLMARLHDGRILVGLPGNPAAALAGLVWLRAPAAHAATAAIGAVLLAVVWASTFLLQVPCHHRLEQGYEAAAIRRLVATNWLRTLAWSGRGACATALLWPLAA